MSAEPAGHAAVAPLVTDTHVHDATVTVRLVKSFAYRTVKLIVLHGIDLTTATPIGLRAAVADRTPVGEPQGTWAGAHERERGTWVGRMRWAQLPSRLFRPVPGLCPVFRLASLLAPSVPAHPLSPLPPDIATHPGFKPFLSVNYGTPRRRHGQRRRVSIHARSHTSFLRADARTDTFKIYHMAHAAKVRAAPCVPLPFGFGLALRSADGNMLALCTTCSRPTWR